MSENEYKTNAELNNTSSSHKSHKKQRPQPGFMSMSWLRMHIKEIIWAVIITFLISLFFIGYGTSRQNAQREEKQRQADNLEAQEAAAQNALPEKLQGKGDQTALTVTYGPHSTNIDAKTLFLTLKNSNEYSKYQQMSPDFKKFYIEYLREGAIGQLVNINLLNLYAKANNIVPPVTKEQVIANEKSQVSPAEFARTLRRRGQTEEEYAQARIQEITAATVSQSSAVVVPVASATEDFLQAYYNSHKFSFKKDDKISFDHLLVDPSTLVDSIEVSDAQIKSYYEANKATLLTSKRIEASHIFVKTTDPNYLSTIVISEADLKKAYEENKDRYTTREEVKASHILIKPRGEGDEEKQFEEAKNVIQAIYEKAKNGEDFAKLASENSEDEGSAKNGGDLGFFGRGAMVKPFEDAAFAAEIGAVTEPVRSQFGYHIIKVEAKNAEKVKTFEEVKEQLTNETKAKMADNRAVLSLEEFRNKVINGSEMFSKGVSLSFGKSRANKGLLPAFFKGEITDDYASDTQVLLKDELCDGYDMIATEIEEQLFAMNKGDVSDVIKTQNGYHLFKIENILDPIQLSLTDTLKAKIKDIVADQLANEEAEKLAKKLVSENASADIEAIAKAYGKEDEGKKHSFKDLPFSTNPGEAYAELGEGIGLFSANGRIYVSEFHQNVLTAAQGNKLNAYLEPFKSKLGWHIVKVTAYVADQYDTFAEVRDSIRRMVTLEPSDAEINKAYEETKSQYDIPATRTTRQILCSDKDTADKVYQELNEGAIFAKMARDYSIDSSAINGGLTPAAVKGQYSPALDEAIWNLKEGEYTQPIETPYGWYIAKLESETQEIKGTLEKATAKIKRNLRSTYENEAWASFMKGIAKQAKVVRNQEIIDLVE